LTVCGSRRRCSGHGLIHLIGVVPLWDLPRPSGLGHMRPGPGTAAGFLAGVGFLVAALLLFAAAGAVE
jgi:hypothetical protein